MLVLYYRNLGLCNTLATHQMKKLNERGKDGSLLPFCDFSQMCIPKWRIAASRENATVALDLQAYKRRLILSASSSRLLKLEGIILQFTRGNHVAEEEVRRDIEEAMDAGRNNPDPAVQTKLAGFLYSRAMKSAISLLRERLHFVRAAAGERHSLREKNFMRKRGFRIKWI